jgi:2',3'-cyclic-nucleotide 2'-phosphodiesterase (5'-nucleotidase family)
MRTKRNARNLLIVGLILTLALCLFSLGPVTAQPTTAPDAVQITILHTNDFHGYLETDYRGRGGSAYMAGKVSEIRAEVGEENVALLDAGDIYLGAAPISQLLLGESSIDIYNMIGYEVAAYGNHEFDKGQDVLQARTAQSNFPWIGANIVLEGTEWDHPTWAEPYVILNKGGMDVGIIGLDTDETPQVTLKGTTDGLVFKDLTETVLHYYDEVKAQADALIVMAHMGTDDSGPYKGLQTVAQELIDAGKPVDLMIGGHQHQPLYEPLMVGDTAIIEAGYYGRWLGRADVSIDAATKSLTLDHYELITINSELTPDPGVEARVAYWAAQVAPIIEQPVGSTMVSIYRDYNNESAMGDLVADGMRWKADQYDDGEVNGSVEIAFTNPGGLRADIEIPEGATVPYTITWGATFNVLPFGNTLFLMDLTGAQIHTLLNQSANLYKGILQSSGITWYWYNDCNCDAPTAWGAYNAKVGGEPLDPGATYRVVTNNFLAPGGDGWVTFAEGTNRWDTYYDMQEGVNEYIALNSPISPAVEGRIVRLAPVPIPSALNATGYVRSQELLENHFGSYTMWTGWDNRKNPPYGPYRWYGTVQFDLSDIPSEAIIVGAEVELTGASEEYQLLDPMAGGEWNLKLLPSNVDLGWLGLSYWDIAVLAGEGEAIGPTLSYDDLGPGVVNTFTFSQDQVGTLMERLGTTGKASFRMDYEASVPVRVRDLYAWDTMAPPVLRVTYYVP